MEPETNLPLVPILSQINLFHPSLPYPIYFELL
jgi:hypothetical protein